MVPNFLECIHNFCRIFFKNISYRRLRSKNVSVRNADGILDISSNTRYLLIIVSRLLKHIIMLWWVIKFSVGYVSSWSSCPPNKMSVRNADIRKYTSETQHSRYLCFKQIYINTKSENRQNNTVIGQISLTFAMLSKNT